MWFAQHKYRYPTEPTNSATPHKKKARGAFPLPATRARHQRLGEQSGIRSRRTSRRVYEALAHPSRREMHDGIPPDPGRTVARGSGAEEKIKTEGCYKIHRRKERSGHHPAKHRQYNDHNALRWLGAVNGSRRARWHKRRRRRRSENHGDDQR